MRAITPCTTRVPIELASAETDRLLWAIPHELERLVVSHRLNVTLIAEGLVL